MRVVVLKETRDQENRVALDPEAAKKLATLGMEVAVEAGAGARAFFEDADYEKAGAKVEADANALLASADLVLKVNGLAARGERHEADAMKPGAVFLASIFPTRHPDSVARMAAQRITAFSTDCIPRTTRAQSMDTLSSQASITGYRGTLLAALELPKYFPMFMTAAGTTPPAKVFVIGAGVAGLQALATAKRLGAAVSGTDVRPEVKEQIESVGAKYVGIELAHGAKAGGGYASELSAEDKARQAGLLREHCAKVDAVITTALIGGVVAPKLLDEAIVRSMRPGSVIIDLGADGGGNCTLSQPGKRVMVGGVCVLAPLNLPSTQPTQASSLFARNLLSFITAFWNKDERRFVPDWQDEIIKGAAITHEGRVLHAATAKALSSAQDEAKRGGA